MRTAGNRIIIAAFIALAAAGCAHDAPKPATVKAECELFSDPGYHVQGKTRLDQFWIDNQLESGYASCGWPRPGQAAGNRAGRR